MKKFIMLHCGFEMPTPEIMGAWKAWFEANADRMVAQGGFKFDTAIEISKAGTQALPGGLEAVTGYNIIEAESLDEAEEIAKSNPFITSIRVYEMREM